MTPGDAPTPDNQVTPLLTHPVPAPPRRAVEWLRWQWRLVRRPRTESGWVSLCGSTHSRNQDAVLAAAPLYAVADGVGGGSAGELASSQMLAYCRDIPRDQWQRSASLANRLRQADEALARALQSLSPGGLSATTFAGAWIASNGRGQIAHVGDSRILRLRAHRGAWQIEHLTEDQTYANLGEAAPEGGHPDDPARMIGVGAIGEPAVAAVHLLDDEMLLLCTDGLHRFVTDPAIAALCAERPEQERSLSALARALAQAALRNGSRDDISVLLVRRNPLAGARRGFWMAAAVAIVLWLLASLSAWVG